VGAVNGSSTLLEIRQPSNQLTRSKRIRLVVLGAGYDLRATRFLQDSIVEEGIELDLPEVMQAKKGYDGI
jgi:O-methyltransferase involved in polyketide biosynthesis